MIRIKSKLRRVGAVKPALLHCGEMPFYLAESDPYMPIELARWPSERFVCCAAEIERGSVMSRKPEGRGSLFGGVSFLDLWRAARCRQHGIQLELPTTLEFAHASRFAAPAQPSMAEAGAAEQERAVSFSRSRQAA